MDDNFWSLIESARTAAGNSQRAFCAEIRAELAKSDPATIQRFDEWFRERHRKANRWDLWGAAYIINGGCSDDGFHDFRSWLISQGRDVYNSALADPESLASSKPIIDPTVEIAEFELLFYAASDVFKERTGKDMPWSGEHSDTEVVGDEWSEDDLPTLFPQLSKAFSW